MKNLLRVMAMILALSVASAEETAAPAKTPKVAKVKAGRVASEDVEINEFHAMGPVTGTGKIFRSANPVRDLVPDNDTVIDDALRAKATARMQGLHARGIRTVMCFQHPDGGERVQVALEKEAAVKAGLVFVVHALSNSGGNSFETMSDDEALRTVAPIAEEIAERAKAGGVLFHCKAGHDRTGIMAGYLRMKYEGWSAERSIAEMRQDGHDWQKYSRAGQPYSWLEEHLRAWDAAKAEPAAVGKQ